MLSNLKAFFKTNPHQDHTQGPPPAAGVVDAGGANAFLAQAVQFVPPVVPFAPDDNGQTRRTNRANEALLHETANAPVAVASLLFPVGLVAGDGAGRLGYEGFVLPTEGGAVPERYDVDPRSVTMHATVARWRDILLRRADSANQLMFGFAGTILPDKLTCLVELFPEPVVVPPPLIAALDAVVVEELGLASAVESVLPAFRADPRLKELYRRIDPGLTPYGTWRLFQIFVGRLGMSVGIGVNFTVRKLVRPLAGDGFFDVPMFEEIYETESAILLRAASGIEAQPDPLGYEGWRIWRNEQAPVDHVILLYGDPLIGLPEQGQTALAWWFATFFREVHISHKMRYDHGYAIDHPPFAAIFVHPEAAMEGPPLS